MSDELNQTEREKKQSAAVSPRPYQKPVLETLGDLRSATLGFSNSIGESGNEGTHGDFPIG